MDFAFMGKEPTMQETRPGSVTLVLGGARSGKSRYAQQLAEQSRHVVFVATAKASDEEMRAKIERHREDRPKQWATVEEPLDLPKVLAEHEIESEAIVVDCLTIFAANLLEAEGEDSAAIGGRVEALCEALRTAQCTVVLVSNEVGLGLVPETRLGRRFRAAQGRLNQIVAAAVPNVVFIAAGLPLWLKRSS